MTKVTDEFDNLVDVPDEGVHPSSYVEYVLAYVEYRKHAYWTGDGFVTTPTNATKYNLNGAIAALYSLKETRSNEELKIVKLVTLLSDVMIDIK